jgi:hypothetical protein
MATAEAVKLTFLFNHPNDPDEFDSYLFEQHLPLTEAVTQISRREVAKIVTGDAVRRGGGG